MGIKLRKSTVVRPAAQTPDGSLWLSNIDLIMPPIHVQYIFFYRTDGSPDFFDASSLKRALSDALVYFYPMAGRLKRGEDGRIAVDCNGEGALFVEAETDSSIDDYGDFAPSTELLKLGPEVDDRRTGDISSYPLLHAQVTYFKCGGVSLVVCVHHSISDGTAAFHFINTWSALNRGLPKPANPPSIDRTPLQARNPPNPSFLHVEYLPPPTLNTPPQTSTNLATSIFKISPDQIHLLRAQAQQESGIHHTTFQVLTAHVWRCACKARHLTDNQETKLFFPVNGRNRLRPALTGYFGNALFAATPVAVFGDLKRQPLAYAARIIHEALDKMDDDYLRSAVDYLERLPDIKMAIFGAETFRPPNLRVTSLIHMPIHDADFGWGRPIFTGFAHLPFEGMCVLIPSSAEDGSFSIAISLQSHHLIQFKQFLYEF